ncbi:MAG: hypothetical protein Q4B23_05455 [Helcococcus sp.]|nr:hypothetical protein [Helcococcus sp.]
MQSINDLYKSLFIFNSISTVISFFYTLTLKYLSSDPFEHIQILEGSAIITKIPYRIGFVLTFVFGFFAIKYYRKLKSSLINNIDKEN